LFFDLLGAAAGYAFPLARSARQTRRMFAWLQPRMFSQLMSADRDNDVCCGWKCLHCIVHVGDRDSEVWKRYSRFSELAPGALSV